MKRKITRLSIEELRDKMYVYSVATNSDGHWQKPYEQDATMRGNQYLTNNTIRQ